MIQAIALSDDNTISYAWMVPLKIGKPLYRHFYFFWPFFCDTIFVACLVANQIIVLNRKLRAQITQKTFSLETYETYRSNIIQRRPPRTKHNWFFPFHSHILLFVLLCFFLHLKIFFVTLLKNLQTSNTICIIKSTKTTSQSRQEICRNILYVLWLLKVVRCQVSSW